jgi:hypothetical protein
MVIQAVLLYQLRAVTLNFYGQMENYPDNLSIHTGNYTVTVTNEFGMHDNNLTLWRSLRR